VTQKRKKTRPTEDGDLKARSLLTDKAAVPFPLGQIGGLRAAAYSWKKREKEERTDFPRRRMKEEANRSA